MPIPVPFSRRTGVRTDRDPPPEPEPSIWDGLTASVRNTARDSSGYDAYQRKTDIQAQWQALVQADPRAPSRYADYVNSSPVGPYGGQGDLEDAFWAERARHPEMLKGFPMSRRDFDAQHRAREAKALEQDQRTAAASPLWVTLPGSIAGSFTDPINVATLPIGGGGGSVLRSMLREGLVNAGVELVEQPFVAQERKNQGRELTTGEAVDNVGLAFLGGAVLTGLGHGAKASVPHLTALWDKLPPAKRREVVNSPALDDHALADLTEAVIGKDRLADVEGGAVTALRRRAEIDAANPFVPDGAGQKAHADRFGAAMQRIVASDAVPLHRAAGPVPTPSAPSNSGGPEAMYNAILGNEGGMDRAGNFRTSPKGAIGPGQIMPGTAPEAARLAGVPFDEQLYRTDAAYNRKLGKAYFDEQLRVFGDPDKAAAAYNAGPGSAKTGRGVRGAMARAERAGTPERWVEFLPAETQAYVANFRKRMGGDPGVPLATGGDLGDAEAIARDLAQQRAEGDLAAGRDAVGAADRPMFDAETTALREPLAPVETAPLPRLKPDFAEAALPALERVPATDIAEPRAPLQRNLLGPISDHAPVVWRETSMRDGELLLPTGNSSADLGEVFVSDTPHLALGQAGNKGVLLEFDAKGMQGQVNKRKPGWDFLWSQGQAEYVVHGGLTRQPEFKRALRRVTIDPAAAGTKTEKIVFQRAIKGLEDRGWVRSVDGDGKVTMARPDGAERPAPAEAASNTEAGPEPVADDGATAEVRRTIEQRTADLKVWDDPSGPAAHAQADSVLHDLKATVAGDGGAGVSVQLEAEGEAQSLEAMLDDIAEDFDIVAAIKGCL